MVTYLRSLHCVRRSSVSVNFNEAKDGDRDDRTVSSSKRGRRSRDCNRAPLFRVYMPPAHAKRIDPHLLGVRAVQVRRRVLAEGGGVIQNAVTTAGVRENNTRWKGYSGVPRRYSCRAPCRNPSLMIGILVV